MATPGLRALRRAYPDARIVGQLPEALLPLLEGSAYFDELWPVLPRRAGLSRLRAGQQGRGRLLWKALADSGILVRNLDGPGLLAGCVRVTIGTTSDNDALLAAMPAALNS